MKFTVGNFLNPTDATDEGFTDATVAYERMVERAEETEHLVVGLYEKGSDCAKYVAIDGEVFQAI
jgi:hypothetical protein